MIPQPKPTPKIISVFTFLLKTLLSSSGSSLKFKSPTVAAFSMLPINSSPVSPRSLFHSVFFVKRLKPFIICLLLIPVRKFLVRASPHLSKAFIAPFCIKSCNGAKYSPTSSLWFSMVCAVNASAKALPPLFTFVRLPL